MDQCCWNSNNGDDKECFTVDGFHYSINIVVVVLLFGRMMLFSLLESSTKQFKIL
jgi:hypothetical protein